MRLSRLEELAAEKRDKLSVLGLASYVENEWESDFNSIAFATLFPSPFLLLIFEFLQAIISERITPNR